MQTLARTSRVVAPLARAKGLSTVAKPFQSLAVSRKVAAPLHAATNDAAASASELADKAAAKAKEAASVAVDKAKETATKLKGALNQATLDVDISQFLKFNFAAQVALTAVSWFVVFTTSHANIVKGTSVNPVALILLVGVALAGYSAYLSFTYLTKAKKEGLGALDGWAQLNAFYEHATFNFIGAAAAILALFASVGTLLVQSQSSFATEALAQAAGNVVLAHLVSLAFLTVLTRKIVGAYEKLAAWSTEFKNSIAKLGA